MCIETTVPGLSYIPGYISSIDQHRLLAAVDGAPWRRDLRRRVQHYGYRYSYRSRSVRQDDYLGPLPSWVAWLVARIRKDGWMNTDPDQLIVNEYLPGQGISAHIDCVDCFGDEVLSISLGSACVMDFSQPSSRTTAAFLLEPGSLLVMAGEARSGWRHAIPARKSDVIEGQQRKRGRRVSLTFRTVLAEAVE